MATYRHTGEAARSSAVRIHHEAGANMPYEYVRLALGGSPNGLPRFDAVEPGLYWVRMIDMGYKLVREGEWQSRRVDR